METLIPNSLRRDYAVPGGDSKTLYYLPGDRIFHNEANAWAEALGNSYPGDLPVESDCSEWMDWWQAEVDMTVPLPTFEPKRLTVEQVANLMPRFSRMTKRQLAEWVIKSMAPTEKVNPKALDHMVKSNTKAALVDMAVRRWSAES